MSGDKKPKLLKAELEKRLDLLQETYNDLLLRYKYVVFDLEATRRELVEEREKNSGKGKEKE